MNTLIAFSFVAATASASGLASTQLEQSLPQKPFPNSQADACPSVSILYEECRRSNFHLDQDTVSFHPNRSQDSTHPYQAEQQKAKSPWAVWPECYTNENITEPYCVFTSHTFANGRGVSLVTTSSDAHNVLKKPAFADPSSLAGLNVYSNPPFEVHEFPIKGRGLVANKTLHKGDKIFSSTPLLIMNPDAYDLEEEERLILARKAVSQLPAAAKAEFWKLLDHFKGDPVDDRINTNAFDVEIYGLSRHVVFPEIAMLNHDCRPNAAYFFDEETLAHYIQATQDIYPGEEITITYINNEMTRKRRVAALKRNWGFDCGCSACTAHPSLVLESDARLKQIEDLETQFEDWTESSEATPEMAETLLALLHQERLFGSLGSAYKHAAMTYSSFGDRWNAIKYARLSIEYSILDKGWRDSDVFAMKQLAADPEMQWSWKKRMGHKRLAAGSCGHVH